MATASTKITRRQGLLGLLVSPIAAAAAASPVAAKAPVSGLRISLEDDDPGYRNYLTLRSDRTTFSIYLDGVEQRNCVTVDESAGYVRRHVLSPKGNVVCDPISGDLLTEDVSGKVEIVFDDPSYRIDFLRAVS
jgi:hypothetical protein